MTSNHIYAGTQREKPEKVEVKQEALSDKAERKKPSRRGHHEGTVCQLKDGRYQGRIRYIDDATGEYKRKAVYGKSPKEVRDKLAAFRKKREKGDGEKRDKTFGEWLSEWLENHVKRHKRLTTWENYKTIAEKHIIPTLGKVKLTKLQADDLQKLYNKKLDSGRVDGKGGLSAQTVGLIHLVAHMALEQAHKDNLIPRNVAQDRKSTRLNSSHT
jgi:hypothetical protein